MKKARSMLLNEEFTSDDDRLTYQSYEKLALICNVCGELVFFKQGIERVSHFSHYKDTGKNKCRWRTQTHDSTQNTDSEAKKQSLEKFQKKIQDIIDEGIIKYQKISSSQLDEGRHQRRILVARRDGGKSLVNQYQIDINSWLSRFYEEREHIQNLALSLYHKKLSKIQCQVFSNITHYLCLPASEDILRKILYYVFFLLNKEVDLNNDFEEVCSKVIEIISFADWEEEYKRAKGLVDTSKFEQNLLTSKGEDGQVSVLAPEKVQTRPAKKVKLVNLANAKSLATNSLEWSGMLAHIPCKVTLVNSHNHWQLEALPIKEIPSYPLLYTLANKAIQEIWQEEEVFNFIISPIDKELARLDDLASKSEDPKMIQKIGLREANLEKLKESVLSKKKLDPKTLSECSEMVKQAISKADYKPSPIDPYFSRYILAQVYFLQTNEDNITYLLDDYMSHKRTASDVQTAVNFLRILPRNLEKKFTNNKPSLKELQDYIVPLFRSKFGGESRGSLELKVRDDKGKILIDVIYRDKVQLTQLLTVKMPANSGKNQGKVSTKVAPSLDFENRRVFEKFLRTKDGRFVAQAMNQLKPLVQVFLSKNFTTLVGENKIGKSKKLAEIIGFERSKQGWGQIKRGFIKYMTPFTSVSDVNKGKLLWLNSNKILNDQDLENLIIKIAENWKNWHRKDQEYILLGDTQAKNQDPQNLVFMLIKVVTERPHIEQLAWKHTIDWICEITGLPIGFRASNGVILTPDSMYNSHVEKWEHRIKIQLINLLLESHAGSIEAWLQSSIKRLYDALESFRPDYKSSIPQDILKHLDAMHDALSIAQKVEDGKLR